MKMELHQEVRLVIAIFLAGFGVSIYIQKVTKPISDSIGNQITEQRIANTFIEANQKSILKIEEDVDEIKDDSHESAKQQREMMARMYNLENN